MEQKNYAVGEQKGYEKLVSFGGQQIAFFLAHPPFSFEGEGTERMQSGNKVNGRVPFWDLVV